VSIIVFALSSKLGRIYRAVPAETTVGRPVDTNTAPGHVGRGFGRVSLETRQDDICCIGVAARTLCAKSKQTGLT